MASPGVKRELPRKLAQFGPFEIDLDVGELRKHGVRLHLQTKPFQVLRALLEQQGRVVTRDELQKQLWPEDTFVDFDRGLNTAVNRLRIALGDSAETPRYIQTLPRAGYRFIAVVSWPAEAVPEPVLEPPAPNPPAAGPFAGPAPRRRRFPVGIAAGVAVLAALCALGGYSLVRTPGKIHSRQITFQRGRAGSARFSADSSILYAAQWEDAPLRLYTTNIVSPESRMLGIEGLSLVSVSKAGELALMRPAGTGNIGGQELFRVPMNGGAPVRVDDNIMGADWSADGRLLTVVRAVDGTNQLEAPAGTVLYRTPGWISDVRWEPDGQRIAFVDHPIRHDETGTVKIFERGAVRALTPAWASARGLAWNPRQKEVWFTAAAEGSHSSVWAVSLSGRLREVTQYPGLFSLRDIAPNGTLLLNRETRRLEMGGFLAGDQREHALSWLDWSRVQSISRDGRLVLFDESGEAVGLRSVSYVYHRDADQTEKIGDGGAMGLSPDETQVLLLDNENRKKLRLAPLGGGTPVPVPETGLVYQWARFLPASPESPELSAIVLAEDPVGALGLFRISLRERTEPSRIAGPMMVRNIAVSPQGDRVAVLTPSGKVMVYPTDAGSPAQELRLPPGFAPLKWSRSGESIFVQDLRVASELPSSVFRFDLKTSALTLWKKIAPSDPIGVNAVTGMAIADDERHYVYSYRRVLSELVTVQGLN